MMETAIMEKNRPIPQPIIKGLSQQTGVRVHTHFPLAKFTAARIGGPAEVLVEVNSGRQLESVATFLWEHDLDFHIIGGGSNVLVSDAGLSGITLLNKAGGKECISFSEEPETPSVWADSGVNFGLLARQAAGRGLSGLEWAAGIPGSVGGAVSGNAGAFGGDTAGSLLMAVILHRKNLEKGIQIEHQTWNAQDLEFDYRTSRIKRSPGEFVVIQVQFRLETSTPNKVTELMEANRTRRQATQPPGASMGSMFKNPPNDHAGRLIEAAGLKGLTVGQASISRLHANFFINNGGARAVEVAELISTARAAVFEKFGISLELEVELLGSFPSLSGNTATQHG